MTDLDGPAAPARSAATMARRVEGQRLAAVNDVREPLAVPGTTANRTGDASARPTRVLLVASAGGHWIELDRLRDAFRDADCQFVSTSKGMTPPLGRRDVLEIADLARDNLRGFFPALAGLFRIARRFDPDLVVSTGAAPGALALLIGKLFGARTIWIDSIANSETLSLSGHFVRPLADLRVTQWEHLAKANPSLRFLGQIL